MDLIQDFRVNDGYAIPCYRYDPDGYRLLIVLEELPYGADDAMEVLPLGYDQVMENIIGDISSRFTLGEIRVIPWESQTNEPNDVFLNRYINRFKPDAVVFSGIAKWPDISKALDPSRYVGYGEHALVTKIPTSWGSYSFGGTIDFVACSPQRQSRDDDIDLVPPASMIGYFMHRIEDVLNGGPEFPMRDYTKNPIKVYNINTRSRFDKLMAIIEKADAVAVDTEATSLQRYRNTLLSIQFAVNDREGYFLPLFHSETPFCNSDLEYISDKLRTLFQEKGKGYWIFHNAKFDMTLLRVSRTLGSIGVEYFKAPAWDTLSGEFLLDENMKFVRQKYGPYFRPYQLDHAAMRYGCTVHHTAGFSKSERKNMGSAPLWKFEKYATYDAVVTFALHEVQAKLAESRGHAGYRAFQLGQFSSMHNAFSAVESRGMFMDTAYCLELIGPQSPLKEEFNRAYNRLFSMPAINEANNLMLAANREHTLDLFGSRRRVFNPNSGDHLAKLMFEVLKLQPLTRTAKGAAQVNKGFFKTYGDLPEVKAVDQFKQLKTIQSNFVVKIATQVTRHADSEDGRLRGKLDFQDVVTGRASAREPNLQNLPEHNPVMSDMVQRMFGTTLGQLIWKMDYNAHEVRGWGNIAHDSVLTDVFYDGMKSSNRLRVLANRHRDEYDIWMKYLDEAGLLSKGCTLDWEGRVAKVKEDWGSSKAGSNFDRGMVQDIGLLHLYVNLRTDLHIQNVKRIFNKDITKDDPLRQAIKTIVFGLIYGKSVKSLARDLKQDEKVVQGYVDSLFKTFSGGSSYLQGTVKRISRELINISPIGRPRHFWGYLHTDRSVHSAMGRRGPNSDIQGMSSDIGVEGMRQMEKFVWEACKTQGWNFDWGCTNYIHDCVEAEWPIHLLPLGAYVMEHGATTLVHRSYREQYGFEFDVGLAVEFNLKATGNKKGKGTWSFNYHEIPKLVEKVLPMYIEVHKANSPGFSEADLATQLKKLRHNSEVFSRIREKELDRQLRNDERTTHTMLWTPSNSSAILPKVAF